ncbi:MAG: type II toxin-antitoxin system HicB family antitoxin [Parcubacteria group bacterium]|nr:type II toxin-antitoxin system HicB family antitoxin [Parcubacteria group bacterium]
MKKIRYNIILHQEPEGGFTVFVPALPGCITYGRTLHEAQRMAADAIRAYVASLRKHREPIPSDEASFIGTVELAEPAGKRITAHA